ncbi:hypothetical protein JJD41_17780 [Oxynema sp. CENA135]|uniref:hypothetical protein n=1 Tax=Oxynema sp. CENA135 TaxID=984206 RepID=UPI00190D198E|nr:hypothetical protein [Oxynema sp. CENA135]MBK4731701.1 hypothetical protein [Oxynema sp. CENA135]
MVLDTIKFWYRNTQAKSQDWLTNPEGNGSGKPTQNLPVDITRQLQRKTEELPTAIAHQKALKDAFSKAFENWRSDPEAPNSLVVLGSPTDRLPLLFCETIATKIERQWTHERSLDWERRPSDYASLSVQLKQAIGETQIGFSDEGSTDILEKRQSLVIVPQLEWCFVRCIEGLEAIELLREMIFTDSSRFWLIGCNRWSWQYFDYVSKLSAYLGDRLSLPGLNAEELKAWLDPILNPLNFEFSEEFDEEKIDKFWQQYFSYLAHLSSGIPSVAADLWWRSLVCPQPSEDEEEKSEAIAESSLKTIKIIPKIPKLPDLPSLLPEDRYLLYSLLLHGGMSLSHLALSLGESETTVQARVHFLWLADAIERQKDFLWVNPAYYPKLRDILESNNFLVGKDKV